MQSKHTAQLGFNSDFTFFKNGPQVPPAKNSENQPAALQLQASPSHAKISEFLMNQALNGTAPIRVEDLIKRIKTEFAQDSLN
jgi:hypothetical protein